MPHAVDHSQYLGGGLLDDFALKTPEAQGLDGALVGQFGDMGLIAAFTIGKVVQASISNILADRAIISICE